MPCTSLFIGPAEHAEFRLAFHLLSERSQVLAFGGMGEFLRALDSAKPASEHVGRAALEASLGSKVGWETQSTLVGSETQPTLVVLAQRRPGEFRVSDVDRLRRIWPLAAMVNLLGSWCEGEPRSGKPLPGLPRVYWYDWPAALERNLSDMQSGALSDWTLPACFSPEDRSLRAAPRRTDTNSYSRLIGVSTTRQDMYAALSDALLGSAFSTCWLRDQQPAAVQGVAAIVWEGVQADAAEMREVQLLQQRFPSVPLLALLDFPRLESVERAETAGIAAIASKPVVVADLIRQLQRIIGASASVEASPRVRAA